MDPVAFMHRVDTNGGIDNDKPDDGEIVTEYLRDLRP